MPSDSGLSRVQICMRDELNQTKNGFFVPRRAVDEVRRGGQELCVDCFHALLGERPVSSHFCLPQGPKRGSSPGVSVVGRDALAGRLLDRTAP